jgi:CheY-like chemotaxis protein
VLLSDIGLPDIDGYAWMGDMRSLSNCGSMVSVAVTGYASEADKGAALEAGFDAHVSKPADVEKLVKLVERLYWAKKR